jgi:2-isopropylmalate synthase
VAHVLERDHGIPIPRWLAQEFSPRVQNEAEHSGGEIDSRRIRALFDEAYCDPSPDWIMRGYSLSADGDAVEIEAEVGSGKARLRGRGHGAVEALVDALLRQRGIAVEVEHFDEHALSAGTDARAVAAVRVRVGSAPGSAVAFGEDTTCAALQAVLSAAGAALALDGRVVGAAVAG